MNTQSIICGLFLTISITTLLSPNDNVANYEEDPTLRTLFYVFEYLSAISHIICIMFNFNISLALDGAVRISDALNLLMDCTILFIFSGALWVTGVFVQLLAVAFTGFIVFGKWTFIYVIVGLFIAGIVQLLSYFLIKRRGHLKEFWFAQNREDFKEKMENRWTALLGQAQEIEEKTNENFSKKKNQVSPLNVENLENKTLLK